jgi:hypothetical protein
MPMYEYDCPKEGNAGLDDLIQMKENFKQLRAWEASATEPVHPEAYMNWLYVPGGGANSIWRQRNAANTGWLNLFEIDATTGLIVQPGRNIIINGCGQVNQRGAYTLVKDKYCWDDSTLYGPDRFEGMATGTVVSAGTFTNTAAANCGVSGYAFKFVGVTLTGTGIIYFRYRALSVDAVKLKNKIASFDCRVYQDTGGAINYTVYVRKADAADNFSAVTAISNSGAISIPSGVDTSLPYLAVAMGDCSNGIEIEIKAECGAIITKNFEFTECQLKPSSILSQFEFRHYAHEVSLCEPYYERHSTDVQNVPYASMFNASTIQAQGYLQYRQKKRVAPTISFSATPGDLVLRTKDGSVALTAIAAAPADVDSMILVATVASGLVAGEGSLLRSGNANATFIGIDAEV